MLRVARPSIIDRWALRDYGGATPETIESVTSSLRVGYLHDWTDLTSFVTRTDPTVASTYTTRRAAVASLPWRVEAGTDDPTPDDELAADLCAEATAGLENVERTFLSLLDGIGRGLAVHEIMWAWQGGCWWPGSVDWVSLRRFRFDQEWKLRLWDFGTYPGPDGYGMPLPPNKFVVHAPKSLSEYGALAAEHLRILWPWLFKRWSEKFNLSGAERYGNPLTVGVVPPNTPKHIKEAFLEKLQQMSADSVGVIDQGESIDIKHMGKAPTDIWQDLIDHWNQEIIIGYLGSSDNVSATHGSNARAESQAETTINPRIDMDAKALASTWRRDLFGPFLRFNRHLFSRPPATPILVFGVEEEEDRPDIPDSILRGRIIRRNEVRERYGLEPLGAQEGGDELLDVGAQTVEGAPSFAPELPTEAGRPGAGAPLASARTSLRASKRPTTRSRARTARYSMIPGMLAALRRP